MTAPPQTTARADKPAPTPRNGIDVPTVFATINAVAQQPEPGEVPFRAPTRWVKGTHCRTVIDSFSGAGGEHMHKQSGVSDADHPAALVGEDNGPTPAEFLLQALGSEHALAGSLRAQCGMPRRLFRRAVAGVAKGVDLAFAGTALNPPQMIRRSSSAESLAPAHRMRGLGAIAGFYNRPEFYSRPSELFPQPGAITPSIKNVRKLGKVGEVLDLSWESGFAPLWTRQAVTARFDAMPPAELERLGLGERTVSQIVNELGLDKSGELAEKYMRAKRNQTAHARWLRHLDGPRPCAVLLHGYMAGVYALEERVWPVRQLFDSGMDVVISVLPFHGPRRSEARGIRPPAFPSSDPRFTIEGLRQLVRDHTALFDYLLAGRVASLGVMGMSLGGYGSALLATLDQRLSFAVLVIPLAAIEDFAHTHGRFTGSVDEQAAQRAAMLAAQHTVSPFARPPLVASDRTIVIAGESDFVTGAEHARRLSEQFKAPITTFEGGHLLQFGLSRAFAPVWEMLGVAGG